MSWKKKPKNDLREYWKNEKFDCDKEFLIYQYLCRNIRCKAKINKIEENNRFKDYKSWRQHILEILNGYSEDTIAEFYHFIKLRERLCDIDMGMHISTCVPLIVAFVGGILAQGVLEMVKSFSQNNVSNVIVLAIYSIVIVIFGVVLTFTLTFILYVIVSPYVKSKNEASFWADCLEVVEEYIENEKENNKKRR